MMTTRMQRFAAATRLLKAQNVSRSANLDDQGQLDHGCPLRTDALDRVLASAMRRRQHMISLESAAPSRGFGPARAVPNLPVSLHKAGPANNHLDLVRRESSVREDL